MSMTIEQLLERVVQEKASDGFVSAGARPSIKVDGRIIPVADAPVSEEEARDLVMSTMREDQKETFVKHHECNYALSAGELGRFRASAFVQRGKCGLVVRRINTDIPTIDELGLPP
ncbi:MAG: type IV pili twitching motility protein PilT, partial [Pseudomonadota bacterium]